VGDICRRLWATFDVESMTWGLALLFASIGGLVCVILASSRPGGQSATAATATASFDFSFALAGGAVGAVLAFCFVADAFHNIPALVGTTLICAVIGFAFVPLFFSFFFLFPSSSSSSFSRPSLRALARRLAERRRADVLSAVAVALFALHGVGLFSNSFIEAEHQVISFLLTSLLLCYLAAAWRRRHRHHHHHHHRRQRQRHLRPAAAAEAGAQYGEVVKLVVLLCVIRFSPSIVGRHESVGGDTAPGGLMDEEDAFPPPIVVRPCPLSRPTAPGL
jgi:hypothetical protein